jgi:DNA-binding IclR family transcriptional regulator
MMTDRNPEDGSTGPGSVQVLNKTVGVLDCFSPEHPRLTLAQIREGTGLPATTVARLVSTLLANDLLQRNGNQYSVGLRVLGWSASATAGSELMEAVGPVLVHLRDLTGETAGIYIRRGTTRVALAVELSRQSVIYRAQIGQVMPIHAGAAGKVFMAFDDRALRATLAQEGPESGGAIANPALLEQELNLVRARGWAYTQSEREQGLNSISVPIRDALNSVVAALTIGGPAFRLAPDAADQIGPAMVEAGTALSRRLGWRPDEAHATGRPRPGDTIEASA